MRKVLIDGGAHTGESIDFFRENWEDWRSYEYHAFEPNPDLHEQLEAKGNIILHKDAIWVGDGTRDFFPCKNGTEGNTLVRGKDNVKYRDPIRVPTIDFSKWLLDEFQPEDHIVLKLDIEGAEYAVLHHMFLTEAIHLVNEFYGELHPTGEGKKLRQYPHCVYWDTKTMLDEYGLPVKDWFNNVNK